MHTIVTLLVWFIPLVYMFLIFYVFTKVFCHWKNIHLSKLRQFMIPFAAAIFCFTIMWSTKVVVKSILGR